MNQKKGSQIDAVQPFLAPDIFDGFKIKKEIKEQIIEFVKDLFSKFKGGFLLVKRICLVGSIMTKQYTPFSDVDINIEVDYEKFVKLNPESLKYPYGVYPYMMDKIYLFLEGVPIKGTARTFSVHIYFYPFILSSDNVLCIYPSEKWIKGFNFPTLSFDPEREFLILKLFAESIKNKLIGIKRIKRKEVDSFLEAFEDFIRDWRQYRFQMAEKGKGHFLSYKFSADWDSGNIFIKFLGKFAKPKSEVV